MTRIADATAAEFSFHEQIRYGLPVIAVVNNYTKTANLSLVYDNDFFEGVFVRLLTRYRPDVVHFQHVAHLSVNLISTASSLGYPTVLSLHDFYFACHLIHLVDAQHRLCTGPERGEQCVTCLRDGDPTGEVRHRFPFMEKALQEPEVVLAPSWFLARRMLSYFPVLDGRLRVVPLGVDRPKNVRTVRKAGEPLRLLYVGVLIPHKGAHILLEALRGLPSGAFELSIYGATSSYWQPYVDRLHEMANNLPVRFCGVYEHDELDSILAQHDVLVMPGICEETFSLMTREALLAGLPVVAARRGALVEALEDGRNGLFFDPENAGDLRRILLQFIEQPDLLARLRKENPTVRTVEEYASDMEVVYAEIGAAQFRAPVLRQRLAKQYQAMTVLQGETQQLQERLTVQQARCALLEQQLADRTVEQQRIVEERDLALTSAQVATDALRMTETALRERDVRLNGIYGSTTWRFYRIYEACSRYLTQIPLRWLRRWWQR
jgi:glycosyltransferase involved in cell wall biosynthesis